MVTPCVKTDIYKKDIHFYVKQPFSPENVTFTRCIESTVCFAHIETHPGSAPCCLEFFLIKKSYRIEADINS